jgi:hypothetical protein
VKILAGLAASVMLLAACNDPHKGQHCTHSHMETDYYQQCIVYSSNGLCQISMPMPDTHSVCDTWVDNTTPEALRD